MNPIVINGTVLCDNITGIPRYVYETVVRLDKLIEGTGLDVRIAYRDDGREIHLPELKNIKLVPLKAVKYFYNMVVLPAYLRREHAFFVGLASSGCTACPPNGLHSGCSPSAMTSASLSMISWASRWIRSA